MVIWQLDNPVDGQPWLYWEHDWHGGGIVGCGQPLGQGGGAVVWEHPLHGCGRKQTEHCHAKSLEKKKQLFSLLLFVDIMQ